jgi:hypothetical protein
LLLASIFAASKPHVWDINASDISVSKLYAWWISIPFKKGLNYHFALMISSPFSVFFNGHRLSQTHTNFCSADFGRTKTVNRFGIMQNINLHYLFKHGG